MLLAYLGTSINNPAVIAYAAMITILGFPIAALNSFVFAPTFLSYTKSQQHISNGLVAIVGLAGLWLIFYTYFPAAMNTIAPRFDGWPACYYLASFLGLPILVGIVPYLFFVRSIQLLTENGG